MTRNQDISRVTLIGAAVNLLLTCGKIVSGILGKSSAMIADGIHSASDLLSDVVVLACVRISGKGSDSNHKFGHGKFESFATLLVVLMLLAAGIHIGREAVEKIVIFCRGGILPAPGWIAFWAAAASIAAKEIMFRVTIRVGRRNDSQMVVANAWHHRSDALSSVGSLLGIGGSILLGSRWTVLDPVVAVIIAIVIVAVSVKLALPAIQELLDISLPEEVENDIVSIISSIDGVSDVHELKTLRSGSSYIIEAHVVVNGFMSVLQAHSICDSAEKMLRERYGSQTQISLHIEPDSE